MGFIHKISQLAGLGDIVNGIVGGLGDFIQNLVNGYLSLFSNWFYGIFLAFATILDVIQLLFRKLAGLEYYVVNGVETDGTRDLALEIINNQIIMNIFWSLMILGGVLLIISTFIAVIKSEYQPIDGKAANGKGKIIGKALKGVFTMATVPVIAIAALFVGNALLNSLDMATSGSGENTKLSGRVFAAAAYEANRAREGVGPYSEDFLNNLEEKNNFGIFIETDTGFIVETVADKIDEAFQNNTLVLNGNTEYDFSNHDNATLAWLYDKIGEPYYPESFSIYNYQLVWYYYDLNNFNFFVGIGVCVMLVAILLQILLGLIKRIYAIVLLFIVAPPIIAITPINEDAYKNWRKEFVKSTLTAYSSIVTMNIYIMLIPVFATIEFFQIDNTMSQALQVTYQFFNLLSQILILIGGAVFFKDFSKTLATIIGSEDALNEGAGKSEQFIKTAGKALGVGGAVASFNPSNLAGKANKAYKNYAKNAKDVRGTTTWGAIKQDVLAKNPFNKQNRAATGKAVKDFINPAGFMQQKFDLLGGLLKKGGDKFQKNDFVKESGLGKMFYPKAKEKAEKAAEKQARSTQQKQMEQLNKAIQGIPGQPEGEKARAQEAKFADDAQLSKEYLSLNVAGNEKILNGGLNADGTNDGTGLISSLKADQDKLKTLKNEHKHSGVAAEKERKQHEIEDQNALINEKIRAIRTAEENITKIKKQVEEFETFRKSSKLTIDQILENQKQYRSSIVETANALKGLATDKETVAKEDAKK